jgi:hypothetical protein
MARSCSTRCDAFGNAVKQGAPGRKAEAVGRHRRHEPKFALGKWNGDAGGRQRFQNLKIQIGSHGLAIQSPTLIGRSITKTNPAHEVGHD